MKQTILLIEDEPHMALGLRDALEFEGFRVLHADRGKDGVRLAKAEAPDAILLDLMLPDTNGYAVCEEIRRASARVPILMLTARSQESDKVRGLDAGADDYVTKPFSVNELVARLRAIFRRAARDAAVGLVVIGRAQVNFAAHTALVEGVETPLSFYEVELLKLLYERVGEVVTRDEIMHKVWGLDGNASNRTVDNFVVKLRRKVELAPERPGHILTVYGAGYKLVLQAANA